MSGILAVWNDLPLPQTQASRQAAPRRRPYGADAATGTRAPSVGL